MTDQQRSDWLSVEEAAPRLGVSVSTLKRRIIQWAKDGNPIRLPDGRSVEIDAEQVERPQGYVWQVRVNGDLPPLTTDQIIDQNGAHSEEPPPISPDLGADQAAAPVPWIVFESERAERQKTAAENADLRERAGRAEARGDLLATQLAAEQARAAGLRQQLVAELRRTWWDRLRGR
jgi:hypothetical protein